MSKDNVDFIYTYDQMQGLSLVGRDNLAWRGYYVPVKAVVDGDLCEAVAQLPAQNVACKSQEELEAFCPPLETPLIGPVLYRVRLFRCYLRR